MQFCRTRIEAFLTVLAISVLIIFQQLVLSIGQLPEDMLGILDGFIPGLMAFVRSSPILPLGRIVVPALILSLMAWLLQVVLPSRRVPIIPLIPGSLLIGFGLAFLNKILSLSIVSLGNRYQAYGVIGGVLVLTLWVWLVGVILYFGQCLSVELAAVRLANPRLGEPNGLVS